MAIADVFKATLMPGSADKGTTPTKPKKRDEGEQHYIVAGKARCREWVNKAE